MPRVKVEHGQFRIPDEAYEHLGLAEGDELEVELMNDAVVLKPSRAARAKLALRRIKAIQDRVAAQAPELESMSEEELDQLIDEEVKAGRDEERSRKQ